MVSAGPLVSATSPEAQYTKASGNDHLWSPSKALSVTKEVMGSFPLWFLEKRESRTFSFSHAEGGTTGKPLSARKPL